MASISKRDNGRRTIQFVDTDRKRKSIRLGKTSQRNAESVRLRVEQLLAAKISGHSPARDLSQWIAGINEELYRRLEKVCLVDRHVCDNLIDFIDDYIATRNGLKPGTINNLNVARKALNDLFGNERTLQSITEGDADNFRQHLLGKKLAENTIRRTCGRARQFFNFAIRKRIIDTNPFEGIPCAVQANEQKFFFVDRKITEKFLDACPSLQWRMLFSLCRFGGLRCPSEVALLNWSDINWEHKRILVHSPKTEHIQGKETRIVPLFTELESILSEGFEVAEEGAEKVITIIKGQGANIRNQFTRIAKRAGIEPWQKPFQNLRSTRETELASEFPMHVVCKWIGNSELVAAKHYLQMTDEHFEKAVQSPVQLLQASAGSTRKPKTRKP